MDTRRIKQRTGTYPIKVRVTYDRKPQEYQTIFDLSEEDYKKLANPRGGGKLLEIRGKLKDIEYEAGQVAKKLDPFTFEEFQKDYILNHPFFLQRKTIQKSILPAEYLFDRTLYEHRFPIFKEKEPAPNTILSATLVYIDQLLQEHRIRTAVSYQTSYYSFARFRGNMRFTDVTVSYLVQYEKWMLEKDYSKTTVGINVRQLRTLFNEAIEKGIIRKEKCYPFGRRRYQPPTSRNIKSPLR
ncbi:phage integrase SAM-like domain-containing protein [Paraflavitalea speifideaquila]|uniref:phage integrase SAM-like domain-containing protein n=1 Tax=Paraflavitalea speifideaquila TaxID=3076558 RepID=UPI0028E7B901|nr:phage integrase SAM-like domain-containing protein [Paraflavitalea speifideiaquila]